MQHTTHIPHVLTQRKFKQVARGLQRRLSLKKGDKDHIPLQSIMQALSQELFAMPYEEAKATLLNDGIALIAPASPPPSPQPLMDEETVPIRLYLRRWETMMCALRYMLPETIAEDQDALTAIGNVLIFMSGLKQYLPTLALQETRRFNVLLNQINKSLPGELDVLFNHNPEHFKNCSTMWEGKSMVAMSAFSGAMSQKCTDSKVPFSLVECQKYLSDIEVFAALAYDDSIKKPCRAGILAVLDSINYQVTPPGGLPPMQSASATEQFTYLTMVPLSVMYRLAQELAKLKQVTW